ncbi:hypothetical protein T4D_15088 [Trichinella pseudospiralis]|uniref:Uncharacterized protein n=1 Tax=Trichinella pseudospiralis TaxID=6337 RepID=A0A0V1FL55_TRIPS|nr:hypothetical protein T4D_15088 [Trichinella pseudospiralis]
MNIQFQTEIHYLIILATNPCSFRQVDCIFSGPSNTIVATRWLSLAFTNKRVSGKQSINRSLFNARHNQGAETPHLTIHNHEV